MPPVHRVPSYRLHKPSGQAVVTVPLPGGLRRDVYLGAYNSPDSRREYARVLAELTATSSPATVTGAAGLPSGPHPALTVDEVLLVFWRHVERHYRTPEGNPTSEVDEIRRALVPLRTLYGHTPAARFGPKALAAVRQHMVGLKWCRTLVNRRVDRVKRAFKWATSEELVPVTVYQALRTLPGLQRGRTDARESDPVRPVNPAHVEATLPFLNRHVRAMVELQRLTGMRPGEVCGMTVAEIDRTGELWHYRPGHHKTAHRGKERVIPLGPRARAVIVTFLANGIAPPEGNIPIGTTDLGIRLAAAEAYQAAGRERDATLLRDPSRQVVAVSGCVVDPSAPLFSPREAREERFRAMRAARKSKVPPSQRDRRVAQPKRQPRNRFSGERYANAIGDAAERAGVPHWHPNQLRHSFATEVRRAYGAEAAQVLLGHSQLSTTEVYAERNLALASTVAAAVG